MFRFITTKLMSLSRTRPAGCEVLSRRSFLVGACAVIGTACISSGVGEALATPLAVEPAIEPDDDLIELVQSRRREDDRRRRDRGRRDRRFSRRDLARQCRRSRRFRNNNRRLCGRVSGRSFGRRGACIQIGPLTVCE